MNIFKIYCREALSSAVRTRAMHISLIVGVILNFINQGWEALHGDFSHLGFTKIGLTFLVPYLVSTYSSTKSRLSFKVNEVSVLDAVLQCKSCNKTKLYINKGEIVPPCNACGHKKTKWQIVEFGVNQNREFEDDHESMSLFAQMNPAPVLRFGADGIITGHNIAAQNAFEDHLLRGKNIHVFVTEMNEISLKSFIHKGEITIIQTKNKRGKVYRFELRGLPQYGIVQMYGADVSEVVNAKHESVKFFTGIEQSSNSVMITNLKGEIEYVNEAFEHISGYRKEEVKGLNPRFLKTENASAEVYKNLWETILSGKVWHGQMLNKRKDGSQYWEESTISPVFAESGEIDNFIAIKEDITEKKKLAEEMERMALFAELNPEPVFRFDETGYVLQSNKAANNAFKMDDIVGENIGKILPEIEELNYGEFIVKEQLEIVEATIYNRIFRFILRGLADNKVVQTYGSDITERKLAEEKIRKQKASIDSSIQYASRIQNAVLPSQTSLSTCFADSFIFFKPRDVVSGDFYWIKSFEEKTIIVAADCTGHGVPGAFMSMLGIALLNEIVNRNAVLEAGQILTLLRENLKTTLAQNNSSNAAKDGMDMALCIVNHRNNHMQYAGAYNSIYLIRNSELIEYKADKMPIGAHIKENPYFTNSDIQLNTNDSVYMLSDGYPDQFGGVYNMKFGKKAFKKNILEHTHLPMSQQKEILEKTFNDWKGDFEQIDDVLVMAFKV